MSEDASLNSPATRPTVTRVASAKLNLALAVGRPTPETDGYHPIASWMVRVDLADDLTVTRLDDDRFSRYAIQWAADAPVRSPIDWSITKDLAVRAHLMLEHRAGRKLPVQLRLDKRIPVGGGLGGASADAAAMLLAVNELHALGLSLDELASVGAQLGSDVPFCLGQAPAFVSGLGERIRPSPSVRADVLLVLPDFGCPTGRVYAEFDEAPSPALRTDEIEAMAAAGTVDADLLFNDLADPAQRVAPRLGRVLEVLHDVSDGLGAHVTGSGSTCFVVCPDGPDQARMIGDDVEAELGDVRTVATRIV
ncbi:MAG: hypothetical protein AAGI30_04140 [Planctomycetota bacterium]